MSAPRKNKNALNNEGGRPTKYKPAYAKQAYKLCLLGATDKELSEFFEVNESTIRAWKKDIIEFSVSLKRGKETADAEVAEKLFKRATGYSHPDLDIKMHEGKAVITKLKKHYPPDTTAAIFWLKNRRIQNWRDKTEQEISDKTFIDFLKQSNI
jgi:hypothetical protein